MNHVRLIIPFLFLGILLASASCGKKAPPFLPKKAFSAKVVDLRGKWVNGYFSLKGDINGLEESKEVMGQVRGCRVYYAKYPLKDPPCDGCPIEYLGHHTFGPEVITEQGFSCRVPGKIKGQIYFFEVHLIGSDEGVFPPSERIKVVVE